MEFAQRRSAKRFSPRDPCHVRFEDGVRAQVLDLSTSGLRCLLRADAPAELPERAVVGAGQSGEVPVELALVRRRPLMGGRQMIAGRFDGFAVPEYRALRGLIAEAAPSARRDLSRLAGQDGSLCIDDRRTVSRMLAYYGLRRGIGLDVCEDGLALGESVGVSSVTGTELVIARPRRPLPDGRHGFSFSCGRGLGYFDAEVLDADEDRVVLATPRALHVGSFRRSVRVRVDAGELVADSELGRHPVVDLSYEGLALWLPDVSLPVVGVGAAVEIALRDGYVTLHALARLRSIEPQRDGNLCGFEIEAFGSSVEADAWREFVFERANPDVRLGARHRADEAWQLLESSNYLGLWTDEAHVGSLRQRFHDDCNASGGGKVNEIVVRLKGRPVAMLQTTLAYPRTWLVHQLMVDSSDRKRVRESLAHSRAVWTALNDIVAQLTDAEHFLIFAERDKRFTSLLYEDFCRRRDDPRIASVRPVRVFRADLHAAPPPAPGLEVEPARPDELEAIALAASSVLPAAEGEASALLPGRLSLDAFRDACGEAGYERDRTVLVARDASGRAIAAAIADSGSHGLNVFGLLNLCRFVPLCAEGATPEVKRALLAGAWHHYQQLGKPSSIFLSGAIDGEDDLADTGFRYIAEGIALAVHRDAFAAWAHHVDEVFASRTGS